MTTNQQKRIRNVQLYGSKIRDYRLMRGMSQGQLAKEYGLIQGHISRYELGKSVPPEKLMKDVEAALSSIVQDVPEPVDEMDALIDRIAQRAMEKIVAKLNANEYGRKES